MTEHTTAYLGEKTVAIFLFHGVIHSRRHAIRNYTDKHVLLDRFCSVLRGLKSQGHAISMSEIVAALSNGSVLPPRAFAVTFDDGFENNYTVAAPVLSELKIPAMFYVTTGFIESNGSSWIDMIEYAFERMQTIRLNLPFSPHAVSCSDRGDKTVLLDHIRASVKGMPALDPYAVARSVWEQLGISTMEPDPELDQKMSWKQVAELSRDPLFTVGGHGHTHRILEYLDEAELEHEIGLSCQILQQHVGLVEHYSYPEGLAYCYSNRVICQLKQQGIVCAPSAEQGTNCVGDDLFHLKRIMVS